MQGRALALVVALTAIGCGKGPTLDLPGPPADPLVDIGAEFVSTGAGTIEGKVIWEGDPPPRLTYHAPLSPLSERENSPRRDWPNPNLPILGEGRHRPVQGAVVYLEQIDPRRSRPWDHPPVRVEQCDYQLHLRQGKTPTHVGFVRRGTEIKMVSCDTEFYALQGRGADFFNLPFADPNLPRFRVLDRAGIVELTSGAGHFWMRGYLFVCDHPYYTRTAADGTFALSQVPPGDYRLCCWMPDWNTAARELDADTWQITRLTYYARPPKKRFIRVVNGSPPPSLFVWAESDFGH
jgi:hypothetical protein